MPGFFFGGGASFEARHTAFGATAGMTSFGPEFTILGSAIGAGFAGAAALVGAVLAGAVLAGAVLAGAAAFAPPDFAGAGFEPAVLEGAGFAATGFAADLIGDFGPTFGTTLM